MFVSPRTVALVEHAEACLIVCQAVSASAFRILRRSECAPMLRPENASGMMTCMNPTIAVHRLNRTMTYRAIAAKVGSIPSTIHRIGNGADPVWSLGNKLIELAQPTKKEPKK